MTASYSQRGLKMSEATYTEAPASATVKFRLDGYDTVLTLRDKSERGLLIQMQVTVDELKKMRATSTNYNSNGRNGNAPACPMHGIAMKESRYGGWYCPAKIANDGDDGNPVYCKQKSRVRRNPMLSPEAQKAQYNAGIRDQLWTMNLSPALSRNAHHAIIIRPEFGGRQRQQAWADWIEKYLPQFEFNSTRNWWQAPLSELTTAAATLPEGAIKSKGAREYLEQ